MGSKRFTKVGLTLEIKHIYSQINSFHLIKSADPELFQMSLVCPEVAEAVGAIPLQWQTWPPALVQTQVFSAQGRTTLQDLCQDQHTHPALKAFQRGRGHVLLRKSLLLPPSFYYDKPSLKPNLNIY